MEENTLHTNSTFRGSLLAGAIGDAMGAPVEFMSLQSILREYGPEGIIDFVENADKKGLITDDTQMLLFTAEGFLLSKQANAADYIEYVHRAYLRWLYTQEDSFYTRRDASYLQEGWLLKEPQLYKRRAPGNTCLSALRSGNCGTVQRRLNNSKGCGGIMRAAPAGLVYWNDPELAFRAGVDLAAITHSHPSGYLASGFLASMLSLLLRGASLMASIEDSKKILATWEHRLETMKAVNNAISLFEKSGPQFSVVEKLGGGWIAEEALAISIFCALHYPTDVHKALTLSVTHSGDTDSTGSITGNIVGLINGESRIPSHLTDNLILKSLVQETADRLFNERN